ncbi:WD40 repeat domain-containing protein [Streptomyces sp. NPDC021218]|uniref:WD40 repeat domain-containing protein n=1 Tax=Streptomyces sp. NPDC021218 TaxID=3365119 RepID=UPI003788B767
MAFSQDGHTLAGGDVKGRIRLWDVPTGDLRSTLTGPDDYTESVAFSPDGRTLASAGADDKIRLWDLPTGKLRITLTAAADLVRSVAFSPDGRTLASAGVGGKIQLRNAALPGPASSIRKICHAVHRPFSPGERMIYLADQPSSPACRS